MSAGYDRILRAVRAARSALRQSEVLAGLGVTALAAGLSAVLLVALDNLFRLPAGARIALLALAAAATIAAFVRFVVRPAARPLPDDAVAVRMDRSAGDEENRIINALQLGREASADGFTSALARAVVERGAEVASRFPARRVVDFRRVLRMMGLGGAAALLLVLYGALLPEQFANAVERYARPTAFVPPLSDTRLAVVPGDAAVLRGEPLTVSVTASGVLPSSARILVAADGDSAPSEMLFTGQAFTFTFLAVDAPFTYRVEAGDASSPEYRVVLAERPEVKRLTLTYRYPDYLGLPPLVEQDATGEIRAPAGTVVTVLAELTGEVTDAALTFSESKARTMQRAGERTVTGEIAVAASETWAILLRSADGLGNREPVRHRITALPDEPPLVALTSPAGDQTVTLPARVSFTVRAGDDHGLAEVSLVTRRGESGDFAVVRTFPGEGRPEKVVTHVLELPAGALAGGEVLTVRAEARDACPPSGKVGVSPPLRLRVVAKEDRAAEVAEVLAELTVRLRDLLAKEQALVRDTEALRGAITASSVALGGLPARATSLAEEQDAVGAEMGAVGAALPVEIPALSAVRGSLLSLAANEAVAASRFLKDSRSRRLVTEAARDLAAARDEEGKIVARLEDLLGIVEAMLARLREDPEAFLDEKMSEADPDAALENALARLKEFVREQEEVLRLTRELEKKDVDDFTDEDKALLEKLAAQESDLARFLEDLKDDLSKLPDQDFSNSTILKELIEAYQEVELAADALTRKTVEMAVPREQSGLELAKSLTENLEKWLPDARDNMKWNMEELDGEYPEIPMADLPEQLEDLVGDLIEEEEQLAEDAEDVTSGWADSIDKGAGWDVLDGPISNMSAQGKTGNQLPNQQEIGGRSGEGRTGRSHGEMVEGEADGKGGRKTPTRLTPDAWEGKSVQDRSKDPLGGATGGGKLAGGAGQGLAGPLPPPVKAELGRLAGNQVQIRQRAETLDRALKALHYPDEDLSRSTVLMKDLEEALEAGDLETFYRKHGLLVEQMKEGQAAVLAHSRTVKDRSRAVPKEILREVESVDLSALPEGYRELLREYYKILSRGR